MAWYAAASTFLSLVSIVPQAPLARALGRLLDHERPHAELAVEDPLPARIKAGPRDRAQEHHLGDEPLRLHGSRGHSLVFVHVVLGLVPCQIEPLLVYVHRVAHGREDSASRGWPDMAHSEGEAGAHVVVCKPRLEPVRLGSKPRLGLLVAVEGRPGDGGCRGETTHGLPALVRDEPNGALDFGCHARFFAPTIP